MYAVWVPFFSLLPYHIPLARIIFINKNLCRPLKSSTEAFYILLLNWKENAFKCFLTIFSHIEGKEAFYMCVSVKEHYLNQREATI